MTTGEPSEQRDPALVYDDAAMRDALGLPCRQGAGKPPPSLYDHEVILYYGGWSLSAMAKSEAGTLYFQTAIANSLWYSNVWYERWTATPGYYRLTLPAFKGRYEYARGKHFNDQCRLVGRDWQVAPVAVAVAGLLAYRASGGDLRKFLEPGVPCWCAEAFPDERGRSALYLGVFQKDNVFIREGAVGLTSLRDSRSGDLALVQFCGS